MKSSSSLEQLLAVSSDYQMGFELLALSEELTVTTRPTSEQALNVSMVCQLRTHATLKGLRTADTDVCIRTRTANLRENGLGNQKTLVIRGPQTEAAT